MTLLNPDIDGGFDISAAAGVFRTHGHVRLAGILKHERAVDLANAAAAIENWTLSYGAKEGVGRIDPRQIQTWPDDKRAAFTQTLATSAREGAGFAYFSRSMTGDDGQGPLPPAITAMTNDLMNPDILTFLNTLTGLADVTNVDAQLSQFRQGHYLTRHTDSPRGQNRKLAFVWGLTPNWHPDWGGLLQFYEIDGTPKLAFAPGFNTLDVFSVEKVHAVTYVAPFAGGARHAVSGWYLG
ncbi:MAG: 2OG-Fe(II) oxygenase family protein [Pseudomonadota bacterium]